MQDLTTGSISKHLLKTTSFMLVTMVFQTLYFLIDLYWVGRLGTDAVAGVGIALNISWLTLALTQTLGVGTTAVVSHAVGAKDHPRAQMLFNQSQMLAMVTGVVFLIVGLLARKWYSAALSADAAATAMSNEYLLWFIPALGLQFAIIAMGSALRAVGNFKVTMVVGTASVVINMVLAPFLIFGWGTGIALGVAGAAISTLIASIVAVIWMTTYYFRKDAYLKFDASLTKPDFAIWRKMLGIGFPTGLEFGISALYMLIVYSVTRPFGAAAQAAFGIGLRIVQSGFMPVVALGFSVAPVAGQNFGARIADRVMATFKDAAYMALGWMVLFGIISFIWARPMIAAFASDPAVIDAGVVYIRIIAFTFPFSGVIFVNSSMFQAMGNTLPSLVTSGVRILFVAIPIVILSRMAGFHLTWIWYLSVGAVIVQLVLSLLLLRREFRRRLTFAVQQP
jgi:putative MATE family efflux protein